MSHGTFSRDLGTEAAKFFRGTPEERLEKALRVDPLALDLVLAGLPNGTTRGEAASHAQKLAHAGRRVSRVMGLPRG